MKKQIEHLYIQGLYNDEAPNVFADKIWKRKFNKLISI